jgi:hypothetical protein
MCLRGQWHEIFDLKVFSSNSPLWAPDSRVNTFFEYGFEFAKLFDKVGASAVLMAPLMQLRRYDTAEAGGSGGLEREYQ